MVECKVRRIVVEYCNILAGSTEIKQITIHHRTSQKLSQDITVSHHSKYHITVSCRKVKIEVRKILP